jgi:ribosomal protein S18 acetylase RimI-like enzyme
MFSITPLAPERLEDFFSYLAAHVAENGKAGAPRFAPLTQAESSALPEELRQRFEEGIAKEFGEMGWRRAWIAVGQSGQILGHIDIRTHGKRNAEHRVMLGMGVHGQHRQQGIGQELLQHVIDYCRQHPGICWLDLEVMADNLPARRLYEKMNFALLCTTHDMFRLDGVSFDYTFMTLNVEKGG